MSFQKRKKKASGRLFSIHGQTRWQRQDCHGTRGAFLGHRPSTKFRKRDKKKANSFARNHQFGEDFASAWRGGVQTILGTHRGWLSKRMSLTSFLPARYMTRGEGRNKRVIKCGERRKKKKGRFSFQKVPAQHPHTPGFHSRLSPFSQTASNHNGTRWRP